MRVLFLFLDGVGLGPAAPQTNPFAAFAMPSLEELLEGRHLFSESAPFHGRRASLVALDAGLGVSGLPQSATGQATLLTGQNVPGLLGYHYGPKPNPEVAGFLKNGNLFSQVKHQGKQAAFLNAYPPRYFEAIESGLRLYSAIPLAAHSAGVPLQRADDLYAGLALSADLTGQGWREHLELPDTPVLTPVEAGQKLSELASACDFSLFEYWLTDYAGHRQDWDSTRLILETLDGVLAGLASSWDDHEGLILLTSDHGNLEDLSTRRHTANPVPALVIGSPEARRDFCTSLGNLADVAPAILKIL
jgi:hypothetical protein